MIIAILLTLTLSNYFHCQIRATIACRILKFEPMIKKSLVANHKFFTSITFSKGNPFAYIIFIVTKHFEYVLIKI